MPHIALLGDSIFDNRSYTRGEPDVVSHLRNELPHGWAATLCAVDGATTFSIGRQISSVPKDATHLAVAIGGNDALQNTDLLDRASKSSAETLLAFAKRLSDFETSYREALASLLAVGLPTVVCTIYNGALPPDQARVARVGLMMFNDVIIRAAIDERVDVIELRAICSEPGDYANPIEPSGRGGLKIARAIARAVGATPAQRPASRVWGG